MKAALRILLFCLVAPTVAALAQAKAAAPASPTNPLIAHNKLIYRGVKAILLSSAQKMPEESYGFKPTEAVRSFGQIVGHVTDSQYAFCSTALGEKAPARDVEKTRTSKADLIAALKDAFAYCDKAYDAMTDASATEMTKLMGRDTPKLGALTMNSLHSVEHYGNLVTYLRMKNIVPPSSDPEVMKELMK